MLIIAYGNPLRGDDGAGWRVAEAAAEVLPAATVLPVHQLTPELSEPISRAERVVFVDAAAEGEPGRVTAFALVEDTGHPSARHMTGSHLTTPQALLAMAAALFGRRPAAYMVTIAGLSFDLSESLSPVVEAAVPEAVATILAVLRSE